MAPRRSTSGRRIRVAASLLMLGGCAGMYEATGTASQQDMLQLRTDLNSLPVSLQRTRAEVDAALAQMDRRPAGATAGAREPQDGPPAPRPGPPTGRAGGPPDAPVFFGAPPALSAARAR